MRFFARLVLSGIFLLTLCTVHAYAASTKIAKGKKVTMEYTLTVDGQVIDSSQAQGPLQYVHGSKAIIPGLEKQLDGLTVGDKKSVTIQPEEGYGPVDPAGIKEMPKTQFPPTVTLQPGMILSMKGDDGRTYPAMVSSINKDTVTLNFNHPLAGKVLNFQINILKIE